MLDDAADTHGPFDFDFRAITCFDSAGGDAVSTYGTQHPIQLTIGDNRMLATVIKVSGLQQFSL